MKKLCLSLCILLPIISHAGTKWELVSAFIIPKEELAKVYLDRSSIKTSDNDIRSFKAKTVYPNPKNNIEATYTVMCSKGLYLEKSLNSPQGTWSHVYSRNTTIGNIYIIPALAFPSVCSDRLWKNKDILTIEFDNRSPGSL